MAKLVLELGATLEKSASGRAPGSPKSPRECAAQINDEGTDAEQQGSHEPRHDEDVPTLITEEGHHKAGSCCIVLRTSIVCEP